MTTFSTKDGYQIRVSIYNSRSYASRVFVANNPDEWIHSMNHKLYFLEGRDAYEVLMSEGKHMTKEEVVRMFF